jgi:Fe-S-cluster containining protein
MEIASLEVSNLKQLALAKRKSFEKLLPKLKQLPSSKLDAQIHHQHHQLFEKIDCLNCANCCKTTSPILLQKDIEGISKFLKIKPSEFMKKYVIMDEDGDFVFHTTPCPFLESDNKCSVYDARPNACREYPHTQQRKQKSILNVSLENTAICPAVFRIFEYLEQTI